jgi:phosphopantothenoylcysteine synthetase/decarboxylase
MQFGDNYSQSVFSDFQDYEYNLGPLVARKYDAVILAAAASDYGVDNPVQGKIRSSGDMTINLKPLPDKDSSHTDRVLHYLKRYI